MRPRAPETLPAQLTRHRIYVLPTASGLFFGLLLGAMLLGALNFNNNPALLLALLLAGAAQASLIAAHMQLSGLRVEAVAAEPVAGLVGTWREAQARLPFARQLFNQEAQAYNEAVALIPTCWLARAFRFRPAGLL